GMKLPTFTKHGPFSRNGQRERFANVGGLAGLLRVIRLSLIRCAGILTRRNGRCTFPRRRAYYIQTFIRLRFRLSRNLTKTSSSQKQSAMRLEGSTAAPGSLATTSRQF